MMEKYRVDMTFSNGAWVHDVVAKNGKTVAICKTEAFAEKVVKGLALLDQEDLKMKNFRV